MSLRITWSAQWLQDSWDYITRPYLKTNEVIIVDPFLQNGDSYVTCFSSLSSTDRTYILFFVGFLRENLTVQPRLSWNLWSSGFCLQNIDITNMDYHTRPREKFIVIRDYIKKKIGCCFETGPQGSQAQDVFKPCYAAKDDFELLVFLLLPPKRGDDRHVL